MSVFHIDIEAWVLQSGEQRDFKTGEIRRFALEVGHHPNRLQRVPAGTPIQCDPIGDCWYNVVGEVVVSPGPFDLEENPWERFTVVDFGEVSAYTLTLDHHSVGQRLSGEVMLSVDYFAYRDYLAAKPGMPPLIYTWRIDKIELDVTPMVMVGEDDARYPHGFKHEIRPGAFAVPDEAHEAWRVVDQTDVWEHEPETDQGYPTIVGGYRFHCTLLPDPPTLSA